MEQQTGLLNGRRILFTKEEDIETLGITNVEPAAEWFEANRVPKKKARKGKGKK